MLVPLFEEYLVNGVNEPENALIVNVSLQDGGSPKNDEGMREPLLQAYLPAVRNNSRMSDTRPYPEERGTGYQQRRVQITIDERMATKLVIWITRTFYHQNTDTEMACLSPGINIPVLQACYLRIVD